MNLTLNFDLKIILFIILYKIIYFNSITMVSESTDELFVNFKGGGSFINQKPQFSNDGENVYLAWKKSILEYNTKTGKLIKEYKGLQNNIVGFSLCNYDGYDCLVACSVIGEILVWKTITYYNIFKKHIPRKKIKSFHAYTSQNEGETKALISYLHSEQDTIKFAMVDIMKKSAKDLELKIDKSHPFFMDISRAGYFAVVQTNEIYFESLKKPGVHSRHYIHNSRTFTCVTCHPTDEIVLTGDSSGRVVVWQNIFRKEKVQSVFHWHTLPVNCVGFSTIGSYFYSGGDECVLVKWQLDNPNQKQFVPRLPDFIKQVSVSSDNVFVALSTADNAVRILDSQLNLVTLIQHLVLGKQYRSGILYDNRTKAIVMNGNVGCVQFYSPSDMSLLYNIEIVGQNKITNERDCTISNTEITKIALSKSNLWLGTVEERKDDKYSMEIRLKFWQFNTEKQKFQLNTSIEYPHEGSVNSIAFQPVDSDDNIRCCTVGEDKVFKIWQIVDADTIYKKGQAWKCAANCFYRDLPCKSLSFSTDGSLMAIGFDVLLTVWTPDSCEVKCVLSHAYHKEKLTHVRFGNGRQGHLVVAASANQLSVWNLLSLTMTWTVRVREISLLVADPLSNHMAVFTNSKKLFVFAPGSSETIYTSSSLLKNHEVVAATFIPSRDSNDTRLKWYERSHLYIMTKQNELFCITNNKEEHDIKDELEPTEKSLFSKMLPDSKTNSLNKITPIRHIYEEDIRYKTITDYLEAPLQTLAPIRFTCFSLLKSMVLEKDKDMQE